MQYFIGIVPPEEYLKKISKFRQKWKNHRIDEVVEPHITLKAQGGLTPDEKWLEKVRGVCENFAAFQISLDRPEFFGEDILYLSVKSTELMEIHKNIVRAISPSADLVKQYFELDDFVPHMTLGKAGYGLSKQELKDMARLAESKLAPYPTFDVNFVRVYREIEGEYVKYLDISLREGF
ncbi:2'-5' RNA ligase family protein [Virgibacillus doumboii]|uniref:2'-5' RNA ligase family protein n=1 Tax=Virgibacillus doumboii TaxID=2697503 RepID=UPI0013DEA671|nr:2'-5' RNA ligase family protein [Virgibacillus doumboii]